MTNSEAIEVLKKNYPDYCYEQLRKAVDTAIYALSAQPVAKDINVPTNDCISRKWLMECVEEGWIKFDTEKDENKFIHLVRDMAPSAQPTIELSAQPVVKCRDCEYGVPCGRMIMCELMDYLKFERNDFCSQGVTK